MMPTNRRVFLMQVAASGSILAAAAVQAQAAKVDEKDPQFDGFNKELAGQQGQELGDQLRGGIRSELGSTRNEDNIRKLQTQLAGSN